MKPSSSAGGLIEQRLQDLSRDLDLQRQKTERQASEISLLKRRAEQLEIQNEKLAQQKSSLVLENSLFKQENSALALREGFLNTQLKKVESDLMEAGLQRNDLAFKLDTKQRQLREVIANHREAIFEKEKQLNLKEMELHSIREQNLELEKQRIRAEEGYRKQIQMFEKDVKRIRNENDATRKDAESIRQNFMKGMDQTKSVMEKGFNQIFSQIKVLEKVYKQKEELLREQTVLRRNIEQLVTENSRMVIDMYNLKREDELVYT